MTDRIVRTTWWFLLMGFVAAAGIGSIYCGYWGIAQLLADRWSHGAVAIVLAAGLAGTTWLACRYRTDLLHG